MVLGHVPPDQSSQDSQILILFVLVAQLPDYRSLLPIDFSTDIPQERALVYRVKYATEEDKKEENHPCLSV